MRKTDQVQTLDTEAEREESAVDRQRRERLETLLLENGSHEAPAIFLAPPGLRRLSR